MIESILLLLAILSSGSIWEWTSPITYVLLGIFAILIIVKNKVKGKKYILKRNNLLVFGIIVTVYIINILLVSKLNIMSFWSIFLKIFVCFIIAGTVEKENFEKKYINIIAVISTITVVFWILLQFGLEVNSRIINPDNGMFYRMNTFYIYRMGKTIEEANFGTTIRNSGFFWEPGAYQAFINLALFFYVKNKNNKLISLKGIALVCGVLSTMSTTGYILLLISLFYYLYTRSKSNSKNNLKRKYIYIIIAFFIAIILLSSNIITEKFTSDNLSYNIRKNDNISGIQAVFVSPIWGLGYKSLRYTEVLNAYGIYGNSSGLLIIMQQFGIIYALWYTYIQCKNFLENLEKPGLIFKILFLVFILIIFGTENINQNLIFMLLVFSMNYNKINDKDENKLSEKTLVN